MKWALECSEHKAEKVAWGSLPPYTNWLMAVGSFFHEPPLSICHATAEKIPHSPLSALYVFRIASCTFFVNLSLDF